MTSVAAINNLGAFAHNPRGNLWFKDESTYGHKLLMKMGWRNGKGLGKNENGIKENLSVKFRNTNSGLGYKEDPYANVMKTEYESILKSLSATCSQNATRFAKNESKEEENKNFEQKSKVIKGKPRYPKLFFGKDVSKYSEKDMKSIFICSLPSKVKEEDLEELPEGGETYKSTLSVSEYFAKKMKEKKNTTQNLKAFDESDQPKFSLDSKHIKTEKLSGNRNTKKRKKNTDISTTEFSNDLQKAALEFAIAGTDKFSMDSIHIKTEDLSDNRSTKKRKKNTDVNTTEFSNDLQKAALEFEIAGTDKFSLDSIHIKTEDLSDNRNTKKRKKKTDVSTTEFSNDLENVALKFEIAGTEDLVTDDKKLSSKKRTNDSESNISQIETDPLHTDEIKYESSIPKKKKQKLSHGENDSSENCELNELKSTQSSNCSMSSKKQKISKIHESEDCFIDNIQHNTKISCQIQLSTDAVLKLRKKRKNLKDKYNCSNTVEYNDSVPIKTVENSHVLNDLLVSDSLEDKSSNSDAVISKKKKKLKNMKLMNLKSCLKNRSGSYAMKNVSFNESVSYRVIDSDKEFIDYDVTNTIVHPVVEDESVCSTNISTTDKDEIAEEQACNSDSPTAVQETVSDKKIEVSDTQICNNDSVTEMQEKVSDEESKAGCLLSGMPKPKSPHYNEWVENQRLALKMKIYKQMLKRLKKHEILGNTNLSSIKGYGNWGFK